jgi:hypothetical protein
MHMSVVEIVYLVGVVVAFITFAAVLAWVYVRTNTPSRH